MTGFGPLTCTMQRDGKQCPRDGVAVYRRPDEGCVYIACAAHDSKARQASAKGLHYTRFEL